MPDQPPSDRFKAEMPKIPGVPAPGTQSTPPADSSLKLGIGLMAVLLVIFLRARWALRPRHADTKAADQQPKIELPTPAPTPAPWAPNAPAPSSEERSCRDRTCAHLSASKFSCAA